MIDASGGQGGRFLKKLPPLDPPAKTFDKNFREVQEPLL